MNTTSLQLIARQRNWALRTIAGFESWLERLATFYGISKELTDRITADLQALKEEINDQWRRAKRRNLDV